MTNSARKSLAKKKFRFLYRITNLKVGVDFRANKSFLVQDLSTIHRSVRCFGNFVTVHSGQWYFTIFAPCAASGVESPKFHVNITGIKYIQLIPIAIKYILHLLNTHFLEDESSIEQGSHIIWYEPNSIKLDNISATGNFGSRMNLETLTKYLLEHFEHSALYTVHFNPTIYPGIVLRFAKKKESRNRSYCLKGSVIIFSSGKCSALGFKKIKYLQECVVYTYRIVHAFKRNIRT